jgi:AcrR family transcriptional regulator
MTEHLVNDKMPRTPLQNFEIREKTKKQILDAGLKVFAVKGYHGTSINDIAKEAGVSKGLAYNYFKSKKELAEAVLMNLGDVWSQFERLFTISDDPYMILEMLIRGTIKQVKQNQEFWRLYVSFLMQIEMAEVAKRIFGDVLDIFIPKLTKVFRQIGVKNPKEEAYILGTILDGLPLDYLIDIEDYPIDAVEKHLVRKYSKEELEKLK